MEKLAKLEQMVTETIAKSRSVAQTAEEFDRVSDAVEDVRSALRQVDRELDELLEVLKKARMSVVQDRRSDTHALVDLLDEM